MQKNSTTTSSINSYPEKFTGEKYNQETNNNITEIEKNIKDSIFVWLKTEYLESKEFKEYVKSNIKPSIEESENKIERKIESSRLSTIETLAILTALFTYVSMEFQAFRVFNNAFSIAGISAILLGGLLCFVLIMHILVNKEELFKIKNKNEKISYLYLTIIILIVSLLIGGIMLLWQGNINSFEQSDSINNTINVNDKIINDKQL